MPVQLESYQGRGQRGASDQNEFDVSSSRLTGPWALSFTFGGIMIIVIVIIIIIIVNVDDLYLSEMENNDNNISFFFMSESKFGYFYMYKYIYSCCCCDAWNATFYILFISTYSCCCYLVSYSLSPCKLSNHLTPPAQVNIHLIIDLTILYILYIFIHLIIRK